VPQGSQQFTPRQLLDAGRHAEAEGRLDLAHQFYRHLADQYGYTSEAAEGRSHLARIGAAGHHPQIWQPNGNAAPALAVDGRPAIAATQRPRHVARRDPYRTGRAVAALVSGIGWLVIAGALSWFAAGAAGEAAQIPALQSLRLAFGVVLQLAGAVLCGAVMVLCGHAARALFDQAHATRELLAITRAKANGDHRQ